MHIFVKTGVKEICIFLGRPICRKYTEKCAFFLEKMHIFCIFFGEKMHISAKTSVKVICICLGRPICRKYAFLICIYNMLICILCS